MPVREGTVAWDDWVRAGRNDKYHAMTFKVRDLDRVATHLAASGVAVAARDDTTIVADPATALGVPWRFTTAARDG